MKSKNTDIDSTPLDFCRHEIDTMAGIDSKTGIILGTDGARFCVNKNGTIYDKCKK